MKPLIFSLSIVALLFAGNVFAQEIETSLEAIVEAETVTTADLGAQEPSLLPTSPFYFFKEIGRGLQRALTFGGIPKTELELKIASEKAAEAKKVAELHPDDTKGISRALLNYERAQERLQKRLEQLKGTSENPNIDRLLDQVAQRAVAHEKLLDGLEAKHESQKSIIQDIRLRVQGTLGEVAKKDTEEKFRERLQDAFKNAKGSTLKHIRSVEILDRLRESDQIPDNVKDRLEELRNDLSEEARDRIEQFAEEGKEGVGRLRDALNRIPGDTLRRSIILEEIRARVSDRAASALDEARDSLDRNIKDGEEFTEVVRERIGYTEERIVRIEQRLEELGSDAPQAAATLLDNAKRHLESARTALTEGNARNAFGLLRAADAIVSNILHILGVGMDAVRDVTQLLDRIRSRIQTIPIPSENDAVACAAIYDPVCGVDDKTYGNQCTAEVKNVAIAHKGECLAPCPVLNINIEILQKECEVKGGKFIEKTTLRCGIVGTECKLPELEDDCPLGYPSPEFFAECEARGGEVGSRVPEGGRCPVPSCIVENDERKYVSRDVGECARIRFLCAEGFQAFSDTTGCGCEPKDEEECTTYKACELGSGEIEEFNSCDPAPPPTWTTDLNACPIVPTEQSFSVDADDIRFSPSEIRVQKGAIVKITYNVSRDNVYYGGLDFRSDVFNAGPIFPGASTTVEFTADRSFEIRSYWPSSGILKAISQVIVE